MPDEGYMQYSDDDNEGDISLNGGDIPLMTHQEHHLKLIQDLIKRKKHQKLKVHLQELAYQHEQGGSFGQTGSTGPFIDISQMYDRKGHNPLHYAVQTDQYKCLQVICEHVQEYGCGQYPKSHPKNKEYLENWINSKSKCVDEFTALHFASYMGSYEMVEYLILKGADPFSQNQSHINMLHCGAQGDKPISLAYFLKMGLDINSRDKRQSTPLHWAIFVGAELAIQYLISNGADVNAQDNEGYTPLHLAVMQASNHHFSTRFIRSLLISGADASIVANPDQNYPSGKKAIDILNFDSDGQPYHQEFAHQVYHLLHDSGQDRSFCQKLNPFNNCDCITAKVTSKRDKERYNKTFMLYQVLMFAFAILLEAYAIPRIRSQETIHRPSKMETFYYLLQTARVFFVLSVIFNLALSLLDPGFIKPDKDVNWN